jgi:hypothetical protein
LLARCLRQARNPARACFTAMWLFGRTCRSWVPKGETQNEDCENVAFGRNGAVDGG